MNSSSTGSAQALVPFTGYYPLAEVPGAFIMVDTSMLSTAGVTSYMAKVTICTDGQNSSEYPWDECSLSGTTLWVGDSQDPVATLVFTPSVGGTQVNGTIAGYPGEASAVSPFAPVELALWNGTYYLQGPQIMVLGQLGPFPFFPALRVQVDEKGNNTVWYGPGDSPLPEIPNFWYDYGMFVIGLVFADGTRVLFEMGTTSGWGRVAGNAEHGQMLVSIQLQQPAPIL